MIVLLGISLDQQESLKYNHQMNIIKVAIIITLNYFTTYIFAQELDLKLYDDGFVDIYNIPKENWPNNSIMLALNLPLKVCEHCHNKHSGSGFNTARFFASAAALAIHDLNQEKFLGNKTFHYVWKSNETDTHCSETDALKIAFKQISLGVDGLIGFTCACQVIGKIATAYNLPVFSQSCAELELSQKKDYPTFARTTTLNADVIYMIEAVLNKFKWKKFAVIYEKSHLWEPIFHTLQKYVEDNPETGFKITLISSYKKTDAYSNNFENLDHKFVPFLDKLPSKARIVLLMLDKGYMRQFLLHAAQKGFDRGDYVFIAIHPFAMSETLLRMESFVYGLIWFLRWKGEPTADKETNVREMIMLAKIYNSLMILMPEVPPIKGKAHQRMVEFENRVRIGMSRPPFNAKDIYEGYMTNVQTLRNDTKPPPESYRLYDAVRLYAMGLKANIEKGQSIRNGTAIVQNIMGRKFQSIRGPRFIVNSKADVQVFFDLKQFQFDPIVFKMLRESNVLNQEQGFLHPKHIFSLTPNCSDRTCQTLRFDLAPTDVKPRWIQGHVPLDEPPCGFMNERCPSPHTTKTTLIVVGIILSFVFVLFIIIPVFLYRFYYMKKKLTSELWKINFCDLFFHDWKSVSTSSLGSLTSQSLSVNFEITTRQRFTTVAIHKNTLVAVKRINKKTVDLNKQVLMELKLARELRHDNLNPFIGACIEPNNILIVTQYATRGSLQDVLENPELRLDTIFILSLVYDIIKGMLHLHSTDIKSHGALKSSNCVVDSRWVLKLTDFGLNEFRKGGVSDNESANHLLWKSPELLRIRSLSSTSRGTQKADVYSFGIILQECHTRDGPWSTSNHDPETIVEKVRQHCHPPFRPVVSELLDGAEGLRDLMKQCWHEVPDERPHFSEIKKEVEVMMKANGLKTNLLDNMIYMMGKYSDDLEEIVEDRTSSLIEEKHKVEALLERMLPRPVAKQLMKGKEVEAETFEEVSIYFSDIVGFTNICAAITPMQVVNLLNSVYTMFDGITKDYDVYKVETIGDAYMVVSGLPIRNGKQHSKEIALLALDILDSVKTFKIQPNKEQLNIRIGLHCGPVVAGVVGTTMPRYCLFGDTVNMASRMESTGEKLQIHVSSDFKEALTSLGGFFFESRGLVHVKGKGELETFWLTGVESHVIRKKTLTKRDRGCDQAHRNHMEQSFHKLIRDSPKLRHKYHVNPDYLPRTPPSTGPDHLPKKLFRKSQNGSLILRQGLFHKKKERNSDHIEYNNASETSNLLRPRVESYNSSPAHTLLENGNLPTQSSSLPNSLPRPV